MKKRELRIHVGTCPMDQMIQNMYVVDVNAPHDGEFKIATVGQKIDKEEERGEWYNRGINEGVDIICEERIKDLNAWIPVDGFEKIPKGKWLVQLEREAMFALIHTANVGKNMTTIGGQFAFDLPKVVAYKSLPPEFN